MYDLKTVFLDNVNPEEFLWFVQNFRMSLEASGNIMEHEKLQYLRTLFCGKAIQKPETMCLQIGSTTMIRLNQVVLGLGM